MKQNVLITGGAGFIGSHLVDFLLSTDQYIVYCIDNFDPFYDKSIKLKNIESALQSPNFILIEEDILNINKIDILKNKIQIIVHLAAKAGVRPSIENPIEYQTVNALGTQYLLEFARINNVKQFVYASSSSVYGVCPTIPWCEDEFNLAPISPYASSKLAGEWAGKVYAHLYNIRFIGLRFFTVYGERQRPDLAIHKFVKDILNENPIPFYGDGNTQRDYTYYKDIIQGIYAAMLYDATMYEIINLGNNTPITLSALLNVIETTLQKKAIINKLPEQQGDVPITYSNINKAKKLLNYTPHTSIEDGITNFYKWKLEN